MGQLLLVRHGQASFGAEDYDVLSPTGWEQGRLLGRSLAAGGLALTGLGSGSLRRQRETGEAIAEGAGAALEHGVDPDWDEFDHLGLVADVDGDPMRTMTRREFQEHFERVTRSWVSGRVPEAAPERGLRHTVGSVESFAGFVERVRRGLASAVEAAGSGETVVVVSSAGPIAVAAAVLTDPDGDLESWGRLWQRFNTVVVNSAVSRVLVGRSGARLLTFNEHQHLPVELLTYR